MLISEQWLREWVDLPYDTQEIATALTIAGLEVEAILPAGCPIDKAIVARITASRQHPSQALYTLYELDTGHNKNKVTIVSLESCIPINALVAYAPCGVQLNKNTKIIQKEFDGIYSQGLLLDNAQIGLTLHQEISERHPPQLFYTTQNNAPELLVGMSLNDAMGLDDNILSIAITPNRGDCLSALGIARELSAIFKRTLKIPFKQINNSATKIHDDVPRIPIMVDAVKVCPNYMGRSISAICTHDVATPFLLKERLRRSGIRSIDPIVDITNYVMLELGQPMHAFDSDKIAGGINVRYNQKDEKITLLNGQKLITPSETLIIADDAGAIAMAGIIGGVKTKVDWPNIKNIFLESAYFDPTTILQTAKNTRIQTESSYRYSRGVDYKIQEKALVRATNLLSSVIGGKIGAIQSISSKQHLPHQNKINLNAENMRRLLGNNMSASTALAKLKNLGFKTAKSTQKSYWACVPSHRFDITHEEDLIEECARLNGYQDINPTPPKAIVEKPSISPIQLIQKKTRTRLSEAGYTEVINYSFISEELATLCNLAAENTDQPMLRVTNPISVDKTIMRTSLLPSLLLNINYNQNRKQNRLHFFEIGRVYFGTNVEQQPLYLAAAAIGGKHPRQWGIQDREVDFYDVKYDVEQLLNSLIDKTRHNVHYTPSAHALLHPGKSADIKLGDKKIGYIGHIHPNLVKKMKMRGDPVVFEIALEKMLPVLKKNTVFTTISKFPEVKRDIALVVPKDLIAESIVENIKKTIVNQSVILKKVTFFDIYQGKNIPAGMKSVAFELTFWGQYSTLTERELSGVLSFVTDSLEKEFGATARVF